MAKGKRKRSGKFYFQNEKEVMESIGLKQTKGSGNGWVEKEDGQNEYILCQLKSTDAESIRIKQLDLQKLEYNASLDRKAPLFIVQFLNNNSLYALMALEDIPIMNEYLHLGKVESTRENVLEHDNIGKGKKKSIKKVKSDVIAREKFFKERQEKWEELKWKR